MGKKLTTETFIERAKLKHGDKYDYSNTVYLGSNQKVEILCKECNTYFSIEANSHLNNNRSENSNCHPKEKYTLETYIAKANLVHNFKYNYTKTEYVSIDKKITVICPIHGIFTVKAYSHLIHGCRGCGSEITKSKTTKTKEKFIKQANKVHNYKFDYSKVDYITTKKEVCIICPDHGEFWQIPYSHLNTIHSCKECFKIELNKLKSKDVNKFIEEANLVHDFKYDYSNVVYINTNIKVKIICPDHGEFEQQPYKHLQKRGCPNCNSSRVEREITIFLKNNNINFEKQKTFYWLRYKIPMYLDFYLTDYNIAIECQGAQHFFPVNFGSKSKTLEEMFSLVCDRDLVKKEKCKENDIEILYFTNEIKFSKEEYIGKLFTDKEELKIEINNFKNSLKYE